ncbi:TIF1B factor, partial [Paradoxornis webbianus]|nr:TIF1B factor [Sinosuthora webbiana]
GARLPKEPRVSLERLELDLELDPAQPPVFRIFPGPSAEEFSVIVIEQGMSPVSLPCHGDVPPVPDRVPPAQEEQQESPIGDVGDTKPVGLPSPPGPGVSCCRVCGQAGAVVMCDRCQRCFHLHCHLPALQDVPSPEWTCLLCQELSPPSADTEHGPPHRLSPQDQQ